MAMCREFQEETGIGWGYWKYIVTISGDDWEVQVFSAKTDDVFDYKQMEKEKVCLIPINELDSYDHVSNLRWLIPMCLDNNDGRGTINYQIRNMQLICTHPEEREVVKFFTMQQFPTQEPGETFSKTVLIYNKEDHSFCDLGYYDFETNEWAILGDMSMKLICWCYIPDASTFINGKELKEELHRGYC